jgi:hypothetical protein
MRKIYLILIGAFCIGVLTAQQAEQNIEQIIADVFEEYTAESEDDIDYETFFQELLYLSENPIDLNRADRELLVKLMFLNDVQIENMLFYIYRFGPLNSIYELQLIDGLDMTDIRRMLPFVVVKGALVEDQRIYKHDLFKYGKSEFIARMDMQPEIKKGYQLVDYESGESKPYAGSSVYNSVKYKYHFKDRIHVGFSLEKDAGEELFGKNAKFYDFSSAHIQLNNFRKFKTIVIGDYKASFGQGLVLNSAFGMGKSSLVLNVNQRSSGLKKYSSTDEYNFFRGMGATIKYHNFETTAFYSDKYIDADTTGGYITSIYKSGLHRTVSEILKRKSVHQQVFGFNATFTHSFMQMGLTVAHTSLNYDIQADPVGYNLFYFRGNKQTTAGLNYRLRWQKLYFAGETAVNQNLYAATVNSLTFSPHSLLNIVLLYRYYSPGYDTFYANSFAENSRVNNESGLYMGVEVRPYRKWKLSAYFDSYLFPWLKYTVDAPSQGNDCFLQIDYNYNRNTNMFLRLKSEQKDVNMSSETDIVSHILKQQKYAARYQINYKIEGFTFRNQIETLFTKSNGNAFTHGVSMFQDMSYSFTDIALQVDVRYQFFDAVDYDNRFYSYEKDVLYAFSIPMYYGVGSRYYLNLKYEFNRNIALWFKLAQTRYADDRETIGSGNDEIQGNKKTDVRFLLKWNF